MRNKITFIIIVLRIGLVSVKNCYHFYLFMVNQNRIQQSKRTLITKIIITPFIFKVLHQEETNTLTINLRFQWSFSFQVRGRQRYDAFGLAGKQTLDSARQRRCEVMSVALRGCASARFRLSTSTQSAVSARTWSETLVCSSSYQSILLLI